MARPAQYVVVEKRVLKTIPKITRTKDTYVHQIVGPRPLQPGAQERVRCRQDGVQELRLPLALPGGGLGPHAVHDRNGSEVL